MAHDKNHITPENIEEWLASTGYLFPRNELELARFEKLFGQSDESITGKEIDPDKIINGETETTKVIQMLPGTDSETFKEYRMVARNGSNIPKHILDKMKKNQDDSRKNDNGSAKEKDS